MVGAHGLAAGGRRRWGATLGSLLRQALMLDGTSIVPPTTVGSAAASPQSDDGQPRISAAGSRRAGRCGRGPASVSARQVRAMAWSRRSVAGHGRFEQPDLLLRMSPREFGRCAESGHRRVIQRCQMCHNDHGGAKLSSDDARY